ncbi:MAG: hypothetical protein WBO45_00550 [Planctomycetota bacterium]
MPFLRVLAVAAVVLATAPGQADLTPFRNLNGTFHIDLPAGWRQVAPNEARRIGELPGAPRRLGLAQPRHFYPVGPVEQWLAGDFRGPWLYIVEQNDEWYIEDDFAVQLTAMWQAESEQSGERHALTGIVRADVGAQQVGAVLAVRTTTPAGGKAAVQSLDVHVPAGGSQLTLSFCCAPDEFAAREPEFRQWLATLTFARVRKGQASLGDRLWTPVLTGAGVGLILLLLYKHNRGRR